MQKTIEKIESAIADLKAIKSPTQNHHTVLALLGGAVERLTKELKESAPAEAPPAE